MLIDLSEKEYQILKDMISERLNNKNKKDKTNLNETNCVYCKDRICDESNIGNLEVEFKCIHSNYKFKKRFNNWEECHKWHHLHWNEVVIYLSKH